MALAIENADLCGCRRSAEPVRCLPPHHRTMFNPPPGILVQPFASDRFNSESLYGRIGYVIAHEIAHVANVRASGTHKNKTYGQLFLVDAPGGGGG